MARLPSARTLLERWRLALEAGGYAQSSVVNYLHYVQEWHHLLGDVHPTRATRDHAVEYIAWCQRRGWQPSTIRHAATAIRSYYRWLAQERIGTPISPFQGIRLPRVQRRIRPTLSEEQVARLLMVDAHDLRGIRDVALFAVAYATGARSISLRRLDVDDVDLERGTIVINSKGGDDYTLGLWVPAARAVERYLHTTRRAWALPDERALFVGRHGRRIGKDGVIDALNRVARRAGVDMHVTAHVIRRSVISHMFDEGADLHDTQTLATHVDPRTTEMYRRISGASEIRRHALYHPMANGRLMEIVEQQLMGRNR